MSPVLADAEYHLELIDGLEIQKCLPRKLHAGIQSYLIRALGAKLPDFLEVLGELNVLCGENQQDRVVPDLTVVRLDATYHDDDLFGPAILCVEIMSPGQMLSSLLDKSERILKGGTPLCWVIWPERCQAWMYGPDGLIEAAQLLFADGPADRLEINLAEMWAKLDEAPPAHS